MIFFRIFVLKKFEQYSRRQESFVCFFKHTKTRKEARVLAPLRENKTYY